MSFKELDQSTDISTQLSVVNEIIPLTGTFFSASGENAYVKKYQNITSGSAISGGFWETVFDGSPTSVSSSALVDFTYGHSSASLSAEYSETFLNTEKQRVYREMAQLLLGDVNSLFTFNSEIANEMFFILLKRRIYKDEVKKGNVSISLQMTASAGEVLSLTDAGAASTFTVGPAGDEASLLSGSTEVGKVYYNAGIVAFKSGTLVPAGTFAAHPHWSGSQTIDQVAISGNLDHVVVGLRNHINQLDFQNQTNLHSTIYFCRALNADFNYSTNPTFIDAEGRIIPTSGSDNQTRSYITTIGLYDINDNLLAVAKTSEPIKKSPDNEVVFRVKLSY